LIIQLVHPNRGQLQQSHTDIVLPQNKQKTTEKKNKNKENQEQRQTKHGSALLLIV